MRDFLSKYNFEFKKYNKGSHIFYIVANERLFKNFDYHKIDKANLKIKGFANIGENTIDIELRIIADMKIQCDICGDFFQKRFKKKVNLLYKFSNKSIKSNSEVIFLPFEANSINLKKIIYDYTILSLPMKVVHPKDSNGVRTCNKEVIEILNQYETNNNPNKIKGLNELKNKFNN